MNEKPPANATSWTETQANAEERLISNSGSSKFADEDIVLPDTGEQSVLLQKESVLKKKRKRKPPLVPWKKPKDMPRRPLSAYNLFFKERREAMMAQPAIAVTSTATSDSKQESCDIPEKPPRRKRPSKSIGIGFANLARTIAASWKNLDDSKRAPYERQAASEKQRYNKEMLVWRAKQKEEKNRSKLLEQLSRDGSNKTMGLGVESKTFDFKMPRRPSMQLSQIAFSSTSLPPPATWTEGSYPDDSIQHAGFRSPLRNHSMSPQTRGMMSIQGSMNQPASFHSTETSMQASLSKAQVLRKEKHQFFHNQQLLQQQLNLKHMHPSHEMRNRWAGDAGISTLQHSHCPRKGKVDRSDSLLNLQLSSEMQQSSTALSQVLCDGVSPDIKLTLFGEEGTTTVSKLYPETWFEVSSRGDHDRNTNVARIFEDTVFRSKDGDLNKAGGLAEARRTLPGRVQSPPKPKRNIEENTLEEHCSGSRVCFKKSLESISIDKRRSLQEEQVIRRTDMAAIGIDATGPIFDSSSLKALGRQFDDETMDFLARLRYDSSSGTSDSH